MALLKWVTFPRQITEASNLQLRIFYWNDYFEGFVNIVALAAVLETPSIRSRNECDDDESGLSN